MDEKKIFGKVKDLAEDISVPEALKPEQVEKRLEAIPQKRYGSRFVKGAAGVAAACLVLVAGGMWFGHQTEVRKTAVPEVASSDNATSSDVQRTEKKSGRTGTSYEILCDSINTYNEAREKDYLYETMETDDVLTSGAADTSAKSAGGASAVKKTLDNSASNSASREEGFSDTDEQVEGIGEGDIVKTDGKHIFAVCFTVNGSKIKIYNTTEKSADFVSDIKLKEMDVQEMYVSGSNLIVTAQVWGKSSDSGSTSKSKAPINDISEVRILVYDVSDPAGPKRTASHTQSGNYNTSRLANGFLYTFSGYNVWGDDHKEKEPETFVPCVDGTVLKEEDIAAVSGRDNNRYMVMTSMPIDNPKELTDSYSAFGGSNGYYMNDEHIYATEGFFNTDNSVSEQRTQITRFGYKDGIFDKQASAQVRGAIENSYYMHEYNGYFCYVYTRYKKDTPVNGLCVMDDRLEVVGEVSGLGKNETIYSSYYMDNMAYFVTYRNTDPVFAVDLSNPEKPKLVSELKLPGFSDYLHSFGEGMLLGVGQGESKGKDGLVYEALKLSLFEYDDKHQLKETDMMLAARGTSSQAGENHKAVFVDEERKLVGLAVENWYNGKNSYHVYQFKNGKWKRVMKQKDLSGTWNVRGLRIGQSFYVVDAEEGISVYDIDNWGLLSKKVK